MANGKCVVLVPVYAAVESKTQGLLDVLASRGYVVRLLRGASQIDLARSSMATEAMQDGFEETFWIDSDQGFDPNDVDRIRSLNLPFTAGLYPCKGPKRFAGKFKPNTGKVTFGVGGGLLEVEYAGMGFTHVRAEVYRKMAEGLPEVNGGYDGKTVVPFFIPMLAQDGDGQCYLSEDYSFCLRAKHCGFPPVVDTRIKVGHIGKKEYTWDDLMPDEKLASVEVEQKQSGEIMATGKTGTIMGITKEDLTAEQANLDQQEAACREEIKNAEQAKTHATLKLEAVMGAKQLAAYLIAKLGQPKEVNADSENKGAA